MFGSLCARGLLCRGHRGTVPAAPVVVTALIVLSKVKENAFSHNLTLMYSACNNSCFACLCIINGSLVFA